ncbi:DNRLRE domain-containing protein [Nonomuraea sp. MCN248]|uniref:DNRLRE domain-containing protein n=1 Tax=Nonomuraea corallina TaxID=2989783 RepID=A0ABT4SCS9_9ACTN|nr:LamG-like jellyroll fold domain-containing protein [Nonomuraea corallina]MDA0635004.1 DNRLRE domain-containing protein [Nonomuraea corallina]
MSGLAAPLPARAGTAAAHQQSPPDTATEQGALDAARQRGERVEVGSLRTETRTVHATPDGVLVLEQHARPVRVRKDGRWTPVDTTLRRLPDGSVAPGATAVELRFSGGGDTPMAEVARGGRSLALTWPGKLPEPALDGATATYAEVLPGVDLQVTADVDGFSHVLVVKTRQAALSGRLDRIGFALRTQGLTVRSGQGGGMEAVDRAGTEVFAAPTPLMWDSPADPDGKRMTLANRPGEGPSPGSRHEAMGLRIDGGGLTLTPDQAMLADPGTRYPVYLDPSVSAPRGAWTSVWKKYPTTNYLNSSDVARVGHENETGQTNRSFFQMNTGTAIHGKQIIKATFRTYETWSWSCTKRAVELWLTGGISKSTTWNNQPSWSQKLNTQTVAKGWSTSCPAGGVEFDATAAAVKAAASNWSNITLGLRATSETDTYAWKKFRNNPTLVVEYNTIPTAPVAADVWSDPGGACVTGDARPKIGTATPKLWAKLRDGDNSVQGRFEWYDAAGTKLGEYLTPAAASGNAFSATVPAGAYGDGSVIRWRARGEDGRATSAWSPFCEIGVDTAAPGREPTVGSAQYPENAWGDGLGRAGEFTFGANGVSDVTSFLYGLNTSPVTEVSATSAGGSATIRLTPLEEGPNVLSVRSKDGAGKQGPIRSYVFNVRPGTGPAGSWRLDEGSGATAGDEAGTHPVTVSGAAWADGRAGKALRFAGSGQYATTSRGVAPTDRNLAVSAWVRLSSLPAGNVAAVSQSGQDNAGVWLGYSGGTRSWGFMMNNPGGTAQSVWARNPAIVPVAAQWTHLAGVYDSASRSLFLYVNGALAAGPVAYHGGTGPATAVQFGQALYQGRQTDSWPGEVDEVRVHDRALAPAEVVKLVSHAATLTGHWKLDEETGTAAPDTAGVTGPLALGSGATWTGGWLDGALALDGAGGHARASRAAVRTDDSFTVTAWVQLDALPAADAAVVAQSGTRASGFTLGYAAQGPRWSFGMAGADADGAPVTRTRSDAVPYAMEWTHVAGVYDALAKKLRVYVGGRLVATTETGHTSTWNATGPLQLGRALQDGAFTGHWPGIVDDVRTYQGALGDTDIARLAAE